MSGTENHHDGTGNTVDGGGNGNAGVATAPQLALGLGDLSQAIATAVRAEMEPVVQRLADLEKERRPEQRHFNMDDEDDDRDRQNIFTSQRNVGASAASHSMSQDMSGQSSSSSMLASPGPFQPQLFEAPPKKASRPFWEREDDAAIEARWAMYRELEAAVQAGATPKDQSIKSQAKALFEQMRLTEKAMRMACLEGSSTLPVLADIHESMVTRAKVLKIAHKYGWPTASVFNDRSVEGEEDSFIRECHDIAEKDKEAKRRERERADRNNDRSRNKPRFSPYPTSTFNSSPQWSEAASSLSRGRSGYPPPSATVTSGAYNPHAFKAPEKSSYDKGYGNDRRRGTCDICHEYGHSPRSCPSRKKDHSR